MKVTKVIYGKTFPIAAYMNERIGVEIEIDDMESEQYALSKAKEMVHKFYEESNKDLVVEEVGQPPLPIIQITPSEQSLIDDINTCEDIKVLEGSYSLLCKKYPLIKEAYDNKYNELKAKL